MKSPAYLQPYLEAARLHGFGFKALLWASPETQAARFKAISRLVDLQGSCVLDAGCGRADFLEYLTQRGWSGRYVGVEAIEEFAEIADGRVIGGGQIIRGDFVRQPELLDQDADFILFCGSLNTLDRFAFQMALRRAARVARKGVCFNFLCSPALAAADHLTWYRVEDVARQMRGLGGEVKYLDDYMEGDCTMVVRRDGTAAR